jgi:hypothetical protein
LARAAGPAARALACSSSSSSSSSSSKSSSSSSSHCGASIDLFIIGLHINGGECVLDDYPLLTAGPAARALACSSSSSRQQWHRLGGDGAAALCHASLALRWHHAPIKLSKLSLSTEAPAQHIWNTKDGCESCLHLSMQPRRKLKCNCSCCCGAPIKLHLLGRLACSMCTQCLAAYVSCSPSLPQSSPSSSAAAPAGGPESPAGSKHKIISRHTKLQKRTQICSK